MFGRWGPLGFFWCSPCVHSSPGWFLSWRTSPIYSVHFSFLLWSTVFSPPGLKRWNYDWWIYILKNYITQRRGLEMISCWRSCWPKYGNGFFRWASLSSLCFCIQTWLLFPISNTVKAHELEPVRLNSLLVRPSQVTGGFTWSRVTGASLLPF